MGLLDKKLTENQRYNAPSCQQEDMMDVPPPYPTGNKSTLDTMIPNQPQERARQFKVSFKDWKGKTLLVTDPNMDTVLYTSDHHMRRPHLRVQKVYPVEQNIATASCHNWSMKIDLSLPGSEERVLEAEGKWTKMNRPFTYRSPAYQNQTLKFTSKCAFTNYNFACETEDGSILARFVPEKCGKRQVGDLQIFGELVNDDAFVEEMNIMAMTLVQYIFIHIVARAGAAGSSASAASSAAAAVAVS